jgi:hypothetical protein
VSSYGSWWYQVLLDDPPTGPLGGDDMLTATPSGCCPVFDGIERYPSARRGDKVSGLKPPLGLHCGLHAMDQSRTVPTAAGISEFA